ncbi:MAG: hypothetical protein ACFB2Z_09075 [Maricaulaceae bacterium]
MEDVIVPVALFAILPVIIWVTQFYGARKRAQVQETLRTAIANNQALTPELIAALGVEKRSVNSDLRWGCVLVASALAFVILGGSIEAVSDEDNIRAIFTGIAAFPGFIGLTLLGLYRFGPKNDDPTALS